MKKGRSFFTITALLIVVMLASCNDAQTTFKKEMQEYTKKLSSVFTQIKEDTEALHEKYQDLVNRKDSLDLDISTMDITNGGKFTLFENTVYYKKEDDGGCLLFATGATPVDDEIKKEMKMLEMLEQEVMATQKENPYIDSSWIDTVTSINLGYPFIDVVSIFPPGMDNNNFPFLVMANEENNPEKSIKFIPEVVISMIGKALTSGVVKPVYKGDKIVLYVNNSIALDPITKKYVKNEKDIILFISSSTFLIEASKGAKEVLNGDLKLAEEIYYLERMDSTENIQDEHRLSNSSQTEYLQKIAQNFQAGTYEFTVKINDKDYFAVITEVAEINYFTVGLLPL